MATATHKATLTTPTERTIHIERIFDAPLDVVWRTHTDPHLIQQWWGRGHDVDIERWEFERGGHWRFVEHSDEGDDGFEGRFREIDAPKHLVQTFEWDGMPGYPSVEDATFEDLGDGRTKVISNSIYYTAEERDGMMASGMEDGLNDSYAALDKLLVTLL